MNEIEVLLDGDVKRFVDAGAPVTIDFKRTPYGEGFLIENGARC